MVSTSTVRQSESSHHVWKLRLHFIFYYLMRHKSYGRRTIYVAVWAASLRKLKRTPLLTFALYMASDSQNVCHFSGSGPNLRPSPTHVIHHPVNPHTAHYGITASISFYTESRETRITGTVSTASFYLSPLCNKVSEMSYKHSLSSRNNKVLYTCTSKRCCVWAVNLWILWAI
jgi:hypothetical protein